MVQARKSSKAKPQVNEAAAPVATSTAGSVVGVLLANSHNRQLCCADKCMKSLKGRSVLSYVIERAAPQVSQLILNANGDPTRFEDVDIPIIPDLINGNPGTATGILTGMEWAKDNRPDCEWIATFATDTPFLPRDLVSQLLSLITAENADMGYVCYGKRAHIEFGLWPVCVAEDLHYALEEDGAKGISRWAKDYETVKLNYPTQPMDPFTSANIIEGMMVVGSDVIH